MQQAAALTSNHIDNLELQIKKEQEPLKRELKGHVLSELRPIIENCFMMPKSKKENFITREKIFLDLLRVFQSQKKFKQSDNIFQNIRYLAVYDEATNQIGKIVSLNLIDQTVTFYTYFDSLNGKANTTRAFSDVSLFDYNSMAMEVVHQKYRRNHEHGMSYLDVYNFLSKKDYRVDKTMPLFTKGYGVEMSKPEENPVMQRIISDYGIPEEEIKKPKKKLYRLDVTTLEVLEEFDSVKEAAEKMGISASTISNVLCQGKSAQKYLEAGNSKWQYSDTPNIKYAAVAQATNKNLEYTLHLD